MKEQSIWKESFKKNNFPILENNTKTKVLIIGGGITGILCAYELKQRKIDYILLEKENIGNGTTKDTTAFVTVQHETLYQDLVKNKGIEVAKEYLKLNLEALKRYKELSTKYNFDFEETTSTIYSKKSKDKILKEKEIIESIGYKDVSLVNDIPIEKNIKLGITFNKQAIINPVKLINELAKELNIYEDSEVINIKNNYATLKNKKVVFFEKIIIATNYPLKNISGLYFMKLTQRRSYVLVLRNNFIDGTYCNIDEGGVYFRGYNNYLIVGGNDRDTKEELKENFINKIEDICDIRKVEYMWSGQDCISLDGIPYIGRFNRLNKDYYVATGFNLWGFTWAMASSFILADLIENKRAYEIVNPLRNMINKNLIYNIGNSVKYLVNFKIPRCSHLGCMLKYNYIENVWECPCHGSRFDSTGEVLKGPAKKKINLRKGKN